MTLLEIERLVRKISGALQELDTTSSILPNLAEDFAAACHSTNLRLQQCEAMLRAGDRHQAIQLAETAPNLLDCVTALEFRSADQWRSFCQQHGLTVAERIDARSVRALNECYAQGIATDHPLYAAYRKATLSRNDEEALKALQSISRLNPSDANAASELVRLDGKVLQARLRHLQDLLAGSSPELIVAEVEAIEGFGFKNQPSDDTWQRAQLIRCGALLEEGERLRTSSNWRDTLARLESIRRLQTEYKLDFTPDVLRRIELLTTWASGEQDKDKRDREFQSCLSELRYRIQQSEEKDTSARQVKLAEMKEDYEGLHKVWRALEDFARPIPEDCVAAFRKRAALLETEIFRRTRIRRRLVVASALAILMVAGIAGWLALGQLKARELARQLDQAVAERKVRTAEKVLAYLSEHKRIATPGLLSAAAAAAESMVNKERIQLKNFQETFAKLPKGLGANPSAAELARIAEQLAATQKSLNALAPDLKAEHQPEVRLFEQQWEKMLADSTATVNGSFERWLASAETQSNGLDYRSPVEQVRLQLAALSNQVHLITECEAGFINHLKLRSDFLQRAATARTKFLAYQAELKKFDDGLLGLQKARTLGAYSEALTLLALSEFSTAPSVKAASAMRTINPNEEAVLRFLIGATNASVLTFLKKDQASRFVPETLFPAERTLLNQLSHDPAVGARHQRVRLWLDAEGAKTLEWLVAGSFAETVGWNTIKAYEPFISPRTCEFSEREYGFFDGKFKLSPTQPIYRIQPVGPVNETAAFSSLGLESLDGVSGSNKPLLEVLDLLKDSREGSPLFRAYLFLRFVEVMRLQPEAWGLTFAPTVAIHRNSIDDITGGQLTSGDWFVTAKVNAWAEKLDQFFATIKPVSYAKQAAGLLAVAREVSKSGLQYVGYVATDGKLILIEGSSSHELWGYSASQKQPTFLGNGTKSLETLAQPPMPLSPLFTVPTPCSQFLAKAGINPDAASFVGALPPLFQVEAVKGAKP